MTDRKDLQMNRDTVEMSKSTKWMRRILVAMFVIFVLAVVGSIGFDYFGGGDKYADYPAADSPF
jgi:predicted negative regulator of RcsB-dependent stress response